MRGRNGGPRTRVLVSEIGSQLVQLARTEVELARAELASDVRSGRRALLREAFGRMIDSTVDGIQGLHPDAREGRRGERGDARDARGRRPGPGSEPPVPGRQARHRQEQCRARQHDHDPEIPGLRGRYHGGADEPQQPSERRDCDGQPSRQVHGLRTVKADFKLLPTRPGPDFDVAVQNETDLTTMNDLLRADGKFDVVAGRCSLYTEPQARNRQITGYVTPLFQDMQAHDPKQDRGQEHRA